MKATHLASVVSRCSGQGLPWEHKEGKTWLRVPESSGENKTYRDLDRCGRAATEVDAAGWGRCREGRFPQPEVT